MRIAIVLPLISDSGRSGGPASVALGHANELARRGHEVSVFSVRDESTEIPSASEGIKIQTFPMRTLSKALGFSGFYGAGMYRKFASQRKTFDVVHVHMARDLITLPVAQQSIRSSIPTVIQPHGMIDPSERRLARILDAAVTRRVLRQADAVLSLTVQEDKDLRQVERHATILRIRNGVTIGTLPNFNNRKHEVIFLARLQERKRPMDFVEIARRLAPEFPELTFSIVGPDGGERDRVASRIHELALEHRVILEGPISPSRVLNRMATARVHVLPSVGEVFPMSMLESFVSGTPTVATSSLGIAEDCRRYDAAEIVEPEVSELVEGVRRALDPTRAEELREGAFAYLKERLDIRQVVDELEEHYSYARARRGQR